MNCFVFTVLILSSKIISLPAWQQYAEPLTIPAMKNEPFVFYINIQWQLTMNYLDEFGQAHMVDYSPTDRSWSERNMDQLMACGLSSPLVNNGNLENVIQLDGLHKRVITINEVT